MIQVNQYFLCSISGNLSCNLSETLQTKYVAPSKAQRKALKDYEESWPVTEHVFSGNVLRNVRFAAAQTEWIYLVTSLHAYTALSIYYFSKQGQCVVSIWLHIHYTNKGSLKFIQLHLPLPPKCRG